LAVQHFQRHFKDRTTCIRTRRFGLVELVGSAAYINRLLIGAPAPAGPWFKPNCDISDISEILIGLCAVSRDDPLGHGHVY
jgi:hypothetical protein